MFRSIGVAAHDRREVFALHECGHTLPRVFLLAPPVALLFSGDTPSVARVAESVPFACGWRTLGKLALESDGTLVDAAPSRVSTTLAHIHLVLSLSFPLTFSHRPLLVIPITFTSFMLAFPISLLFPLPLAFTVNLLLSLLLHLLFPLPTPIVYGPLGFVGPAKTPLCTLRANTPRHASIPSTLLARVCLRLGRFRPRAIDGSTEWWGISSIVRMLRVARIGRIVSQRNRFDRLRSAGRHSRSKCITPASRRRTRRVARLRRALKTHEHPKTLN